MLKRERRHNSQAPLFAARVAAQAVSRSETALGAFFRRMRAKHGVAKAIVYHMPKDKREHIDHGADCYEHKHQEQVLKRLKRQAARLGMKLVPATT